jgi:hypothetical protein
MRPDVAGAGYLARAARRRGFIGYTAEMESRGPDRHPRPDVAFGGVAAAVLLAAALVGASSGCITAFAPNIRREEHHGAMTSQSTRGACLKCHELESHMAKRMVGMDPATLERHMVEMNKVIRPPLVADWMAKDRRGCVECHTVKGGG